MRQPEAMQTTGNQGRQFVNRPKSPVQRSTGTGSLTHYFFEVTDHTARAAWADTMGPASYEWVSGATVADQRSAQIDKINQNRVALLNRAFDAAHTFSTPESERLRILNQRIAALVPGITAEETSELESITEFLEQVQSGRLRRLEKFGIK